MAEIPLELPLDQDASDEEHTVLHPIRYSFRLEELVSTKGRTGRAIRQ